MLQQTLAQCLGVATNTRTGSIDVCDLFCGAGGFSCGAAQAGCRVIFACDADEDALNTHKLNHPEAVHLCTKLPQNNLPLPGGSRKWHLHGSPPCQKFSTVNTRFRRRGDGHESCNLVEWFLGLALSCGAHSWSMEEVVSKDVVRMLEVARSTNPSRVAFAVFCFADLGVPQTRVRLIAGTPALVGTLLRARESTPRRSIKDVLPQLRGTHVRNDKSWLKQRSKHARGKKSKFAYTKAKWTDFCRDLRGPAPTVLQSNLWWITVQRDSSLDRLPVSNSDCALLQCFPETYRFPANRLIARKQIANAVPPLVAKLMLSKG